MTFDALQGVLLTLKYTGRSRVVIGTIELKLRAHYNATVMHTRAKPSKPVILFKSQLGGGASLVIFKLFATTAPATQSIIRRYCSLVVTRATRLAFRRCHPHIKLAWGGARARGDHHADVRHSWRVAAPGVRPGLRRAAAAAPPTAPAPTRSHRPRRRRILPRPGPQGLAGERGGDPGPSPFRSPRVGQALGASANPNPNSMQAVLAARAAGLKVFLATGRARSGPWVKECLV